MKYLIIFLYSIICVFSSNVNFLEISPKIDGECILDDVELLGNRIFYGWSESVWTCLESCTQDNMCVAITYYKKESKCRKISTISHILYKDIEDDIISIKKTCTHTLPPTIPPISFPVTTLPYTGAPLPAECKRLGMLTGINEDHGNYPNFEECFNECLKRDTCLGATIKVTYFQSKCLLNVDIGGVLDDVCEEDSEVMQCWYSKKDCNNDIDITTQPPEITHTHTTTLPVGGNNICIQRNKKIVGYRIDLIEGVTREECIDECMYHKLCKAVNYYQGPKRCGLYIDNYYIDNARNVERIISIQMLCIHTGILPDVDAPPDNYPNVPGLPNLPEMCRSRGKYIIGVDLDEEEHITVGMCTLRCVLTYNCLGVTFISSTDTLSCVMFKSISYLSDECPDNHICTSVEKECVL